MTDAGEFHRAGEPDFAVPPGETILEFLEELGMSQRQLATRLDLSPKHVNQLVQGLVSLSPEVAERLESVTGMSARMWNRLEADYQTTQQRLRSREDLNELQAWLDEFPVRELIRRGVFPQKPNDAISRIQQLLSFFGVAHESTYRELYQTPAVSFRQSRALEADPGAVAAWLRISEIAAQSKKCQPFDRSGFEQELEKLRRLTLEPFSVSVPLMREICSRHGIAVVVIPEVKGARVCGATKWLNPDKAMLVLSGRYRTDDQFWFTFFHEVGHILKHGKKDVWIEAQQPKDDPKEEEANRFAGDLLIPPSAAKRLPALKTIDSAKKFAREIGIAPGIVIGRLNREGLMSYRIGQKLKRKVDLDEFADA